MKAWCPRCEIVDYVNPRFDCCWCGESTLKARARPGQPHPGSVSVSALRKAHRLHAEGATLREAAAAVEHGYSSTRILAQRFPMAWAALGLPYRSIADAQRLRYAKIAQRQQRPDITIEAVNRAIREHLTMTAAAVSLGCSRKTVKRRLERA